MKAAFYQRTKCFGSEVRHRERRDRRLIGTGCRAAVKGTLMIPRTSHSQPATERLRFVYAPICAELDEVEDLLRGEVRSDFPFIDQLAQHGFQLGGKRLRPALVLLSGLANGRLDRNHLVAAAVLELIHTATLIHDDVLDEAILRRHLQTVNAGWGNEASVLLGDYLFARSICMAATFADVYVTRSDQRCHSGHVRGGASPGRDARVL